MPDITPNDPKNNSMDDSGSNADNMNYELITAYIDNEIKDTEENEKIQKLIQSDFNYYNRYIFEKLTKESFKNRIPKIETPVYVYRKIGEEIENYIQSASKSTLVKNIDSEFYSRQIKTEKSNLKRNLIYSSAAFIILIIAAFAFNNFLNKNPELRENDLVAVSRNIFDKMESGQIKLQYQSSNAKELSDSMNKYLDFDVFIPDVKDAILIGGICDEINGEDLAHIIHKKGNIIIYTLQACKKHVMTNQDKIILSDQFKENINEGKNWFPCLKDKNKTVVVWSKDSVICSTVAAMEHQDITSTLTNYK